MLVVYGWCPVHGRRATALLGPLGLRRCDAAEADRACRRPLTHAVDGHSSVEQARLLVAEDWAERVPAGSRP